MICYCATFEADVEVRTINSSSDPPAASHDEGLPIEAAAPEALPSEALPSEAPPALSPPPPPWAGASGCGRRQSPPP